MTSRRELKQRLDALDADSGDRLTVTIREHLVDGEGESVGVFAVTTTGPDGTETERFDPPKPAAEVAPDSE